MQFGTSGIRGLYGKDVIEELAYKIANVFAEKDVAIARDTRRTSSSLVNAAISGILARGKNVIDLGIVPTPTLALATITHKCNGIMITASHNPEEYNGIKLFSDGKEISKEEEKKFIAKFEKGWSSGQKNDSIVHMNNEHHVRSDGHACDKICHSESGKGTKLAKWDCLGSVHQDNNAIANHKEMIKKLVNGVTIGKKKPKVIVDANGAATVITSQLLHELGCEVISINAQLLGFTRGSEPCTENLTEAIKLVKSQKADLAVTHDGDGDRCIVIDDCGEVLPLDIQLAIMIENEMATTGEKKIISTVEASLLIREAVEKNSGTIVIGPVGSAQISHDLEKNNAIFGGEPCGEYIFATAQHHTPDGVLAAAKFVEIFVKHGKLSELKKKYPSYPMIREKFKCEKNDKYETIKKIIKDVKIKGKRNEQDGLRIDEADGWFLIRASGTEPVIRLTMEYKNRKKLEERAKELREIICRII
ncbi:MAG: hypothetical protein Q7S22_08305 [Candidatus Micrarchaeota archaeon]|nr:hypothetical protein [Candidatus Micrarchaeota archaeon]